MDLEKTTIDSARALGFRKKEEQNWTTGELRYHRLVLRRNKGERITTLTFRPTGSPVCERYIFIRDKGKFKYCLNLPGGYQEALRTSVREDGTIRMEWVNPNAAITSALHAYFNNSH